MDRTLVLAVVIVSGSAWAEEQSLTLAAGHYQDLITVGVGWAFPDLWKSSHGTWELSAHPEVQIDRHRTADGGSGADNLWQVTALGVLRMRRSEGEWRPYAEVAVGGGLFSRVHFGDRDLATAFQFNEQVGLGIEWHRATPPGGGWIGWRACHYSNAGMGDHNPGLNTNLLVVGLYF